MSDLVAFALRRRIRIIALALFALGAGAAGFKTFALGADRDPPSSLPYAAKPEISSNGPVEESYRYRVVGQAGYSVTDLKTLERWMLEPRFKAVPGVIGVTGWSGKGSTVDVTIGDKGHGDDMVRGAVLMRHGEESLPTIQRVEAELQKINTSGILPPGVKIERIDDQSDRINATPTTVLRTVIEGMTLVLVLTFFGLRSLRPTFLPHLEESNLWVRAAIASPLSVKESQGDFRELRHIITSHPKAETVIDAENRDATASALTAMSP
jgi:Cu/Ag efflux pump CusA